MTSGRSTRSRSSARMLAIPASGSVSNQACITAHANPAPATLVCSRSRGSSTGAHCVRAAPSAALCSARMAAAARASVVAAAALRCWRTWAIASAAIVASETYCTTLLLAWPTGSSACSFMRPPTVMARGRRAS